MPQKSSKLRLGKVPEDVLRSYVLKFVGRRRSDVLLPPRFGEDAGVIKINSSRVVVALDPITGARELIGWLSIHINANDVAVCGAEPRWFSSCILLPKNVSVNDLKLITNQIHIAAKTLGVAVVTGHTEVAPYVTSPIVIGHMTGVLITKKMITTSGARPGDYVIMTKTAGIEGTAILANDFEEKLRRLGVPKPVINDAKKYYRYISVVKEALWLATHASVSAMHDPTEGGIIGGLYELSKASNCGFKVLREMIPVSKTTEKICRALNVDPLRLMSSGALLATIRKEDDSMLKRIKAKIIGKMTNNRNERLLIDRKRSININGPVVDELWQIIQ